MSAELAICLKNATKSYRLYKTPGDRLKEALLPFAPKRHQVFHALHSINLQVSKGEVLGVVGVNGAGKSTLLKLISGVITPTSGTVSTQGSINAILELGAALKPELTGRQNIRLNLQINGHEGDLGRLMEEIIAFADIGAHLDQPVKTYSSGMKARLGFALATSTEPDILIVDEVLAVGDIAFQRKCYTKIEAMMNRGKTIIFVSHSSQSVIEFCTRAILLHERKIVLDGDPKQVTDFYQKLVFGKDHEGLLASLHSTVEVSNKAVRRVSAADGKSKTITPDFYLPELKGSPQPEYNFDVQIDNVEIIDQAGLRVNLLVTGDSYIYRYLVRFNQDCAGVSFGMHIKTLKGLGLASSALHYNMEPVGQVPAGTVYQVEWRFRCNMLAGIYLTNAGVFSDHGQNLSRIVDAYMFKVKQDSNARLGIISLDQELTFTEVPVS